MAETTVDAYIAARPDDVRAVLLRLRRLVQHSLPDAAEIMRYGAPVYVNAAGKEVVYLYGGRDHANLGFLHGAALDDPEGALKGKGTSGRHVKLYPGRDWPEDTLTALLAQCR